MMGIIIVKDDAETMRCLIIIIVSVVSSSHHPLSSSSLSSHRLIEGSEADQLLAHFGTNILNILHKTDSF